MPEWQERLTRDTKPSIRAEHDLRYAAAAPVIASAPTWLDLGCGAGVAAADALGDRFNGHAILVDASEDALDEARATIPAGTITTKQADLADEQAVARVRDAALAAGEDGCVTCFEVIEHLRNFVPALELMIELATTHGYTAILSVPNDAFWSLENPFHETMWGEGAFEELRRLLPADHVIAKQVPLTGSAVVFGEGGSLELPPVAVDADRVPSHFLAAFGARAHELAPRAAATAADLDGQRTWERQREAQLAFLEAELTRLDDLLHEPGRRRPRWLPRPHSSKSAGNETASEHSETA
jgi:SAM-dependent methyltransferase